MPDTLPKANGYTFADLALVLMVGRATGKRIGDSGKLIPWGLDSPICHRALVRFPAANNEITRTRQLYGGINGLLPVWNAEEISTFLFAVGGHSRCDLFDNCVDIFSPWIFRRQNGKISRASNFTHKAALLNITQTG